MNFLSHLLGITTHRKAGDMESPTTNDNTVDNPSPAEQVDTQQSAQQENQTQAEQTAVEPATNPGEATQAAVTGDAAQVGPGTDVDDDTEHVNALDQLRADAANLSPSEIPSAAEVPALVGALLFRAEHNEAPKPLDERNQ